MKIFFTICILMSSFYGITQSTGRNNRTANTEEGFLNAYATRIWDYKTVMHPPIYTFGIDSARHFYYYHFSGMDSLLTNVINHGDTATYIRVYFSFVVDKNGSTSDINFERISKTPYAKSSGSKTIKYFAAQKDYYNTVIKRMINEMGFWKPALHNGVIVNCKMEDYFQVWVGINPPPAQAAIDSKF